MEISVFFISSLMIEHLDMTFDENALWKEQGSYIPRETRQTPESSPTCDTVMLHFLASSSLASSLG